MHGGTKVDEDKQRTDEFPRFRGERTKSFKVENWLQVEVVGIEYVD